MRISWLAPDVIAAARTALTARGATWDDHFTPAYQPPPPPEGLTIPGWDSITEHVARAERVSEVVREQGIDEARAAFGASDHAVELATLASAALQAEELDLPLVVSVLTADVDEMVFYAPFLELLMVFARGDLDRAIAVYEDFVTRYQAMPPGPPDRRERISAVRDGLASAYVAAGRLEAADALFATRHDEDRGDVAVALSASRAFLAAGEVARAVHWLGLGTERAEVLGRADMAATLRGKAATLRQRLS